MRSLALPQKVALVIGLAAAAVLIAAHVATDGYSQAPGGWFAYAPGTEPIFTDEYFAIYRPSTIRTLWAPLALIAAWTAASVWVLGRPKPTPEETSSPP